MDLVGRMVMKVWGEMDDGWMVMIQERLDEGYVLEQESTGSNVQ